MKNFKETTLAELVTGQTEAAVIFEKYQLDFCCNGKRSLQEACEQKGLDTDQIVTELEAIISNRDETAPA